MSEVQDAMIVALNKAQAERDEARAERDIAKAMLAKVQERAKTYREALGRIERHSVRTLSGEPLDQTGALREIARAALNGEDE